MRDLETGRVGTFEDFLTSPTRCSSTHLFAPRTAPLGATLEETQSKLLAPPRLLLASTSLTSGQWHIASGGQGYCQRLAGKKTPEIHLAEETLKEQSFSVASPAGLLAALQAFGTAAPTLLPFYQKSWFAREAFFLFRRRTSMKAQIVNIIVGRVRQLQKLGPVVVAWGSGGQNGSFGKGNNPPSLVFGS